MEIQSRRSGGGARRVLPHPVAPAVDVPSRVWNTLMAHEHPRGADVLASADIKGDAHLQLPFNPLRIRED